MAYQSLPQKLEKARLLIYNSKDPQIAALLLDKVGIDEAYITEGETLFTEAKDLSDDQKQQYQEERLAYDLYFTERDIVKEKYENTLKRVTILSRKDPDLQNRLKLHAEKVYAIDDWIDFSSGFYKRLLREKAFLNKLTRFKLTEEELTDQDQAVVNLQVLRAKAKKEEGEAQQATLDRNRKLEELDDYCVELRGLAKIALEDKPQLLEKLGITVRSTE